MSIEGELVVHVEVAQGRVRRAQARAERPRLAGRLFRGRAADEVPGLAGTLFAICGRSQAIAATCAIENASGGAFPDESRAVRDARIAAETIQEHAWRLLVDWPRLANLEPAIAELARGRGILAPLLDAKSGEAIDGHREAAATWAQEALFGCTPAAFLRLDGLDAFRAWAQAGGTGVAVLARKVIDERATLGASRVAFLPFGTDRWIARALAPALDADPDFDERPALTGGARETGALARTAGHPLVEAAITAWGRGVGARLVARLVETAAALVAFGGRHGAITVGEAAAIGWVDTARGLLVHRVALQGSRVADYRIVAPTEWNFHPQGAFARGAEDLNADDARRLEEDVRWLVASLDPCVAVRYEVGHA